ncbi:MAG: sialidase [Vicinamibacterales bacterium]
MAAKSTPAIWILVAAMASVVLSPTGYAQPAARVGVDLYSRLHWRFIGPEGNRFSSAAGVPGDPHIYYVGAASGGIYKTSDGGVNWTPVFDDQPVQSIGSLAVTASDTNIVWAGTGEGKIRSHISVGQGIYKSMDAGKTWMLMGLEQTGRIPRIVIDPKDPNVVLACALGHAYGPQPDRGVFRTIDGGQTWSKVLFVDENTGCSDIAMDRTNPRVLFAGMWQLEIHTWGRDSGGPGSGLFKSTDGGATWHKLSGSALPTRPVGKVAVAIAQSNPDRVYAMIETGDGVPLNGQPTDNGQVWRSDDAGGTWKIVSYDHNAMGRAHYYSRMAVAPDDEDETYFLTASFNKSIDGAQTLFPLPMAPGGDHHDIWIDPTNANRMIVAHDQGLSISINRGRTWFRQRLTNAQIYHVTVDNEVPYNVLGNKQDEPSYRGPSNSRLQGGFGGGDGVIPRAMWHSVSGGESGWATPDPVDSKVVWSSASGSGSVGGIVVRFDENRRQFRNVEVWPYQQNGPAADLRYRFVWDAPLQISPHDRHTIYVGSQHVHRTTDDGQSWTEISPDLTLNDKTRQGSSGGLTPDNIGVEYAGVVYAIAESPKERGLIWAGTNDGLVHVTRDAGKTWTNVTKNLPNLPPWGSVRSIVPSRYDAATTYLTVDFHQVNNRDPFVYKTTDYGKTWRMLTNGVPRSMLSYAKVIQEDPVRRGLLYLGTENAIYVTFDDGENWQPLQNDLPHAPVSGIVVQEHFNDLVISTYGRGFFILDDISPLQQLTPQVMASDLHLFPPRPAYRFRPITPPSTTYDDPTVGENPKYGASINYYFKAAPQGSVTLTIVDARGEVVRSLAGTRQVGLNRTYWDLRSEPTKEVRLRTSPTYAPQVRVGADGTRPAPGAGQNTMLLPPGSYTVKLSAGGREVSQPLIVRKDPNSGGSDADVEAQSRMLVELRGSLNAAVDTVNQIEMMRSQIEALARLTNEPSVTKAADELNQQLMAVEMNLIDLRITGGQDGVRYASKLVGKINYLAGGLSSADFKPTDQQLEAKKVIDDQLRGVQTQAAGLRTRVLSGFNDQLRTQNLPIIVVPSPR